MRTKSCCDGNYVFGGNNHSVECKTPVHKPNAFAYGLCKQCRDYFDSPIESKKTSFNDMDKHEELEEREEYEEELSTLSEEANELSVMAGDL